MHVKKIKNIHVVLTCLETVISSKLSYPKGLCFLSELSNVIVTVAFVTPACPPLYTSSCKLLALTYSMYRADDAACKSVNIHTL